MKQSNCIRRAMQRGFTLIELVVVVGIIGVLISVLAPAMMGSKDGASAQLLIKTSGSVAGNWLLINQACGTSTAISSNVIPAATKTVSDVLFNGSTNVAATYATCYGQSKVMPLAEVSQPSGSAGVYNVGGFAVSLAGGGTSALQVSYAAVPDAIVLIMAQKFDPTLAALAASDNTSVALQYGTATAGARTVTLIKQMN